MLCATEKLYATEKGLARGYVEKIDGFDNLKEYETEILGLKARAISYTSNHGEGTFYYYLVEKGLALFEIRAFGYNECFTEAALIAESMPKTNNQFFAEFAYFKSR